MNQDEIVEKKYGAIARILLLALALAGCVSPIDLIFPPPNWVSDNTQTAKTVPPGYVAPLPVPRAEFKGNIATWSGIPPLPKSASKLRTAKASAHCSIGDAVFHRAEIWAAPNDCQQWVLDAQHLSESAPSREEVEAYFMTECSKRISGYGMPAFDPRQFDNQGAICQQAFRSLKADGRPVDLWDKPIRRQADFR